MRENIGLKGAGARRDVVCVAAGIDQIGEQGTDATAAERRPTRNPEMDTNNGFRVRPFDESCGTFQSRRLDPKFDGETLALAKIESRLCDDPSGIIFAVEAQALANFSVNELRAAIDEDVIAADAFAAISRQGPPGD